MQSTDFVVARNDLQRCKLIETQLPDAATLPDEALLVKVTRFALTANSPSLYITSERPSSFATPSATVRMVPVFFLTALLESLAICCSICAMTELILDGGWRRWGD